MDKNARWIQRFSNYEKAFLQLKDAISLANQRKLSNLEEQGLIQSFEYTHELAWKCLKDFIQSRGNAQIYGSKDATREAFKLGLIKNGEIWMSMIKSRNLSSHIYDEAEVKKIVKLIIKEYFSEFELLKDRLSQLKELK